MYGWMDGCMGIGMEKVLWLWLCTMDDCSKKEGGEVGEVFTKMELGLGLGV